MKQKKKENAKDKTKGKKKRWIQKEMQAKKGGGHPRLP